MPVEFLQRIYRANVERLTLTLRARYVESRLQLNTMYVIPTCKLYRGEILTGEFRLTIVIPLLVRVTWWKGIHLKQESEAYFA
jgi:hypothetical protein